MWEVIRDAIAEYDKTHPGTEEEFQEWEKTLAERVGRALLDRLDAHDRYRTDMRFAMQVQTLAIILLVVLMENVPPSNVEHRLREAFEQGTLEGL